MGTVPVSCKNAPVTTYKTDSSGVSSKTLVFRPHHTFTHRQAEPSEQIFLELQKKLSNRKQSFKQTFISIK